MRKEHGNKGNSYAKLEIPRDKQINIRVTEEDYNRLIREAEARNWPLAHYIRFLAGCEG